MDTLTEVANLALSHVAVGKSIASLDEQSEEARACKAFMAIARQETLTAIAWPGATVTGELSLVEEFETGEWRFSYLYPPTALRFHRILSGQRTDSRDTRVPYRRMTNTSNQQLILTDMEEAEGEWTIDVETVTQWSPKFVMAMSYRLASLIAPRVTKGDPFKLGDRAFQFYQRELEMAAADAINEEQPDQEPASEFERIRN